MVVRGRAGEDKISPYLSLYLSVHAHLLVMTRPQASASSTARTCRPATKRDGLSPSLGSVRVGPPDGQTRLRDRPRDAHSKPGGAGPPEARPRPR